MEGQLKASPRASRQSPTSLRDSGVIRPPEEPAVGSVRTWSVYVWRFHSAIPLWRGPCDACRIDDSGGIAASYGQVVAAPFSFAYEEARRRAVNTSAEAAMVFLHRRGSQRSVLQGSIFAHRC